MVRRASRTASESGFEWPGPEGFAGSGGATFTTSVLAFAGRGRRTQQGVGMQPQLGLPGRTADEEDQVLVIHVGQPALAGQGGGETLAKHGVEGGQPTGALDHAGKPGSGQRVQRSRGQAARR